MILYNLGLIMVRLRWWVIGFWVVVFALSLVFAPRSFSSLKSGFGQVDTESRTALRQMTERFDIPESSITLVFSSDDLHVTDPEYVAAVETAIAPLSDIAEVERVVTFYNTENPHMVSPDGRTSYAFVLINAGIDAAVNMVSELRERLEPGALQVWVTGGIAIFADIDKASARDLRRAELVTIPLIAVALVLVFGTVVAAGLPIAMGLLSISMTLALIYLLAQYTDMSIFVINIASFLGLGIAVDYSLLMVSRFREELGRRDVETAVAVTCATAGKAIVFSGGTSVIGLSGLLFFQFMMLRSLGIGGVTVILFSTFLALSLIPALLAVLGGRVNSLSIFPQRFGLSGFWSRLSGWVMKHPLAVIFPVIAVLLLLGAPFFGVKLGNPWASILPEDVESRQGWDLVADKLGPGELAPIVLVSTSETDVLSEENIGGAYDFVQRMSEDPRVSRVDSIFSAVPGLTREQYQLLYASPLARRAAGPEMATALMELTSESRDAVMIRVVSAYHPVSDETKSLVADIRASLPGGDLRTLVTGVSPDLADTVERLYSDFPIVIAYVAIASYIALFLLFRSVILPLKAILMNGLSILASFGALVFVFQNGHFQDLLGFTSEGFTEASVPILLFCITFGLSMDYEVFLLSRIKEEYEATGDNTRSVSTGMERSGRVITGAAIILILVASGLATGDILIVKALGFGIALAIFIDASIVRALLVPAIMRLMSGLNWWAPGFLKGSATTDKYL